MLIFLPLLPFLFCSKLLQGLKEQQAALDLVIGPEGAGQVRPNLVAACCFALADMLLAQQRVSETKVALATAYEAAQHIEDKGAVIRALMNYAYVVRHSGKPRSARNAYTQALELARSELGACHPTVEQVKYEYTAYLAKVGRTQEAADILAKGAEELMAEGDRLEKEAPADAAKANGSGAKDGEAAGKDADPGSGLEHIAAEAEAAAAAAEEETLPPAKQARHFAMRNLMNAAGLLDNLDEHDKALETLNKAMDIAISVHGENSVPHMNTLYAIGVHCKRRGALQDALTAHETVLNMMDETIQVYEPEMLQNRVSILRDTALLYDQLGDPEGALDYAQGALVNAQTLSKIMAAGGVSTTVRASMMEPFWLLLADLKAKTGDVDGAAEAKREALRGKLNQGRAARGGRAGAAAGRTSGGGLKRAQNGAGATRAGGRRV